jgi:uncharacterized protein involved in exopolysaccharide biosynthesis
MTMGEKEDQPLSLKDLLANYGALARRGLRYWLRGTAVFAVIMLVGMAWVITRPRTYRSEARFQVVEQERSDGNGPGAEEVQRSIDNRLSQVYGSRTNIITLITRLHLYPLLQGKTSETKLAELFWGSLDRSVATDTVQIGFKYGDPEDAQRVVQGLIDLFVNARRSTAVERAREALTTVDAQVHQLEASLAERQQALDQFVLANQAMVEQVRATQRGTITINSGGAPAARPAEVDNRTSLRTRRLQARIAQLTASVEALRNPNQTAAPAADEPPELTAMRERVRAKQTEVEGIRARGLTADHPTRAAAERELLGMQAQLNTAIARQRGAQQSAQNLSQAERESRIESVNRDIQQARVELAESQRADNAGGGAQPNHPAPAPGTPNPLTRSNIVAVEAEYNRLTTDVTTTRVSYQELFTRKLNNQAALRRAELSGGEQIRILDAPSRPIEPEPPGRTKMAMIVSVLAMIMALGTALISGFIDTRIYDQDDLRRWGELAELPFIPDLHFDGAGARPRSAAPPA